MTTINDGGSAFPSHGSMGEVAHEGMALRDYFAAKAMQAFAGMSDGYTSDPLQIEPMVKDAYKWADAMLKARMA